MATTARPAGGVVRVTSAHGPVKGYRVVWLAETVALCHGLRRRGLGGLAAAVHAIAAGADDGKALKLKFLHSADVVDEVLSEIRS
ncbi:hypothetical protein GKE82_05840 [Conexibacter sp. W3-3-2]|uniref:hypothetical protein n=1 Tax=Conexibacter sp. W3-3-2 TaxID=2675227 RepID=UPI0012BA1988|nr:hypothetical protein [Conexibacter sp. W3-3-2]MTD43837.1 hypothetical protein [Conexibacter sp. W3-3-2]